MARCLWLVVALGAVGAGGAAGAPLAAPVPPGVERIVFVGDSLVNRSDQDHGLLALVRRALGRSHPGVALDLVNAGVNGNCIADIRARLAEDVLARRPDAVVLYWDSDAADAEGADESPARRRSLRANYERDLDSVLSTLREATSRVFVSGPTLLGERPQGENPKDKVLDAYAEVNRRLCHAHHAIWVDTRQAAFRWLRENARGQQRESGRLTEDGEHLNEAGADLVADRVAEALGRWLGRAGATRVPMVQVPAAPVDPGGP